MKYKIVSIAISFFIVLGVAICSKNCFETPLDEAIAAIYKITSSQEAINLELLEGGNSDAKIYKATIGEKSYVVRIISTSSSDTNRREISLLQLSNEIGLGPKVLAQSGDSGWIVMEYIPSSILALSGKEQALQLAKLLQKLHAVNVPYTGVSFHEEVMRDFWRTTIPSSIGNDAHIKRIIKSIDMQDMHPLVWCHRDVNFGNVLLGNDGLKLIDFERSWMGSLFSDLADASFSFFHGTPYEPLFLQAYFDREMTQEEIREYTKAKIVCFYLRAMQMLLRIEDKAIDSMVIASDISCKDLRDMIYTQKISLDDDATKAQLAKACFGELVMLSESL